MRLFNGKREISETIDDLLPATPRLLSEFGVEHNAVLSVIVVNSKPFLKPKCYFNSDVCDSYDDSVGDSVDDSVDVRYGSIRRIRRDGLYGETIFSAFDKVKQRMVEIRRIKDVFADLRRAKRLLHRLAILLQLSKHPCISRFVDITMEHQQNKVQHLSLVFTPPFGGSLVSYLTNPGVTRRHIVYLLYQTLTGLKYMHSAGLYHNNLRPRCCLVNLDCSLAITDFDSAGVIGEQCHEHDAGLFRRPENLWYKSPEQICECEFLDGKTDMWNVGLILGELLLKRRGARLIPGRTVKLKLTQVLEFCGLPQNKSLDWVGSKKLKKFMRKKYSEWIRRTQPDGELKTVFARFPSDFSDLLQKLLVVNPKERLTAHEAIEHPLFRRIREQCATSMERVCEKRFVRSTLLRSKYWVNGGRFNVADEALQIFGGNGYIKEYPMERYVRDNRVHRILEGTNEIMRVIVARRVLMEDAADLL